MQDGARANKADAGNNLGCDSGALSVGSSQLPRQHGKHGRAKTDEHVGAQASWFAPQLAHLLAPAGMLAPQLLQVEPNAPVGVPVLAMFVP